VKRSTKAALLSALVFPGVGHLYLKRWVIGVLLLGIATVAAYYIGSVVMDTANSVAQKIESGAVPLDADAITALVAQESSSTAQATNMAETVWLVCWVVGIAGSYWQGRAQD
jgi:hypothetical protein